jgi:hypothetical protein
MEPCQPLQDGKDMVHISGMWEDERKLSQGGRRLGHGGAALHSLSAEASCTCPLLSASEVIAMVGPP